MVEILSWSLELLAVIGCLHKFQEKRLKLSLPLFIIMIYDGLLFYGINHLNASMGLSLSFYAVIIIYSLFVFKNHIAATLSNVFLAVIIVGIMQLVFCIPVRLIAWSPDRYILNGCIVNALCFAAVMAGGEVFHLTEIASYVKEKSFLTYLCIGCMMAYLLIKIYNLRRNYVWSEIHYTEILIWMLLIFVMWIQVQKNKAEKTKTELQLLKQEQYVQSFEEQLTLVKFKQHDFKNHLSAFEGMIEENADLNKLRSLQKDYSNYLFHDADYKKLVAGGHPVFTGFLNNKIAEMESHDIRFRYEIAYTEFLGLRVFEWIEAAGVLLDNAMEAVKDQPECKKQIFMTLCQRADGMELSVSNISRYIGSDESSKFFQLGYSSKGENRGIGLAKLKEMMIKKHGEIFVRNKQWEGDNWIEFRVCVKSR